MANGPEDAKELNPEKVLENKQEEKKSPVVSENNNNQGNLHKNIDDKESKMID